MDHDSHILRDIGRLAAGWVRWGALFGLGFLGGGEALAAHRVVFQDYRSLIVQRVEDRGESVLLDLGKGNEMLVPAESVLDIREYVPPPPEPEPQSPKVTLIRVGPPLPRWRDRAGVWSEMVEEAAQRNKVDPALIVAVGLVESRLDAWALSPKGAQGVMQLMPGTARQLKVGDVWDPGQNIEAGARWLKRLLDRFNNNVELALAAYNAGEEAVKRYSGVPPYPETLFYVREVQDLLEVFKDAEAEVGR